MFAKPHFTGSSTAMFLGNQLSWVLLLTGGALLALAGFQFGHSTTSAAPTVRTTAASYESTDQLPTERRYASIEDIQVGQQVLAYDPASDRFAWKPVKHALRKKTDHLRILSVCSSDGDVVQELRTTDEHPFWVPGRGWLVASDLCQGDPVLVSGDNGGFIASTRREEHPEIIEVFNLTVDEFHTYFVAGEISAPAVLVHNAAPGKGCGDLIKGLQDPNMISYLRNLYRRNQQEAEDFMKLYRDQGVPQHVLDEVLKGKAPPPESVAPLIDSIKKSQDELNQAMRDAADQTQRARRGLEEAQEQEASIRAAQYRRWMEEHRRAMGEDSP